MIRSYTVGFYQNNALMGECSQVIAQSPSSAVEVAVDSGYNPGVGKFIVCVTCENQKLHFRFEVILA